MSDLIHIRVGRELKKKMQELIDLGIFTNQAEIAREGIRTVLLKYYSNTIETRDKIIIKNEKEKNK